MDDDFGIQLLIRRLLERENIHVDTADDGAAALRQLHVRHYDALVLDLMLRGTNGFELIRHLALTRPEVLERTVVVTAAANRTLGAFDAGAVRKVLRKPFDIDEFVREVLAAMRRPAPRCVANLRA